MTKIFVAGYYGLNNIGDEAILSGMMCSLNKHIDDAHFSVITNDPIETEKIHNVIPIKQSFKEGIPKFALNCVFKNELYNVFRQIDNCDIFILGGGSLLQDLRIHYLPFLLSMVYYAQKKGKKTVVYGIGAGPIDTMLGKKLCRKILGSADLVTVRDPMSKSVLEKCGLQDVIQTADPAFGLNLCLPPLSEEKDLHSKRNYFATTLYNWLQDSDKNRNFTAHVEVLEKRRKIISSIYSEIKKTYNRDLYFIPTVKIDYKGYLKIMDLSSDLEDSFVVNYTNNLTRVVSLLSKSDVLIGMRLHSLILASMIGIPIVPISYCAKTKSYLDMFGLGELYLNIEDLESISFKDNLRDNIGIVENDKDYYAKLLRDTSSRMKKKALYNAKLCSELI
jgi:polysaccharide pyruvyl transferase CsaB